MSRRVQVVLPDPVADQLHDLAAAAGEPPSTLAGQMVRRGLGEAAEDGKVRPLRPALQAVGREARGRRARWLEPYGGDRSWRGEMWGAVVALHARYPRHLGALKDEWWLDDAHTEMLCALAVWRGEIDDAGGDPREELAFHGQLEAYTRVLREQGGGVARAWVPGAPPAVWDGG